ncbi:MAG: TonB-dependent receptor plug domain-containing protein, partial [Gammaproteobacteria bacterium]|nr:TonB-dependent receptor plug domain-containing protein [Gammaproteobacteria bacterium]
MIPEQMSMRRSSSRVAYGMLVCLVCCCFASGQSSESPSEIEELVVTGSRIERNELSSTTPIVKIEVDEIKWQGTVRVEDALRQMPQIWSRQNAGHSYGATGTATLDLRNLGAARTLFLINGRRMPAGSPLQEAGGADMNQVPGSLINRIEVLTGGASTTYGSDAVSGVVNFIMDDKFQGVNFDFQHSFYRHSNGSADIHKIVEASGFEVADEPMRDGEITQYSLTLGGNLLNGGNIVAFATYRDIKAISQAARDYSSCALNNTADACWGSSTIPEGRVTNFQNADTIGFDYKVDGSSFVPRAGTLFNYGPSNYFQRPDERVSFGTLANSDVSENTNVFAEFLFADDHTLTQIA